MPERTASVLALLGCEGMRERSECVLGLTVAWLGKGQAKAGRHQMLERNWTSLALVSAVAPPSLPWSAALGMFSFSNAEMKLPMGGADRCGPIGGLHTREEKMEKEPCFLVLGFFSGFPSRPGVAQPSSRPGTVPFLFAGKDARDF